MVLIASISTFCACFSGSRKWVPYAMYGIFTDIDDSFLMVHFHATCRFAHLALVAWDISWLLKRNCQLGPPSKKTMHHTNQSSWCTLALNPL